MILAVKMYVDFILISKEHNKRVCQLIRFFYIASFVRIVLPDNSFIMSELFKFTTFDAIS